MGAPGQLDRNTPDRRPLVCFRNDGRQRTPFSNVSIHRKNNSERRVKCLSAKRDFSETHRQLTPWNTFETNFAETFDINLKANSINASCLPTKQWLVYRFFFRHTEYKLWLNPYTEKWNTDIIRIATSGGCLVFKWIYTAVQRYCFRLEHMVHHTRSYGRRETLTVALDVARTYRLINNEDVIR